MRLDWSAIRPTLVAVVMVLAPGLAGCWGDPVRSETCFIWPDDVACPGKDVVVFYLGDADDDCNELTSIDSPGERRGATCCYHVSKRHNLGCDFRN